MRAALLLLPALALVLAGCRNQADAGEEMNYLRTDPTDYGSPVDTNNLMPLKQGMRWEYGVERTKGDPYREETVVLSNNGNRAVIESRDNSGKVISRETYQIDKGGIWVTSVLSGTTPVPVNPPLPLLPLPIEEGKVVSWQGTIGAGKDTVAGRAWARITRRQKVKTPAGEFSAYRVDLRTDLAGNTRNGALIASRWFAPGVGIVRTRAIDSRYSLVKELLPQKKTNSSATTGVK